MTALPPIAKIAELLGGDVQGGQVLCPGPGHGAGDRSLSVKPDPADREGFVTHSFAGDDWKDCRAHVRKKLGLPEPKSKKNGSRQGVDACLPSTSITTKTANVFSRSESAAMATAKSNIPQYHWDGNGWAKGKPSGPKIPYRLPQLIAAPTTAIVYFVRGREGCRHPRQDRLRGHDGFRGRRGQMGSRR